MTFYKQLSSIGTRTFDDILILIDHQHAILHEMNSVATRVWALCDGNHSIQDMTSVICEEFDVSADEAQRDIEAFVHLLLQRKLIESI